jgi:hypothetical protein
VGLIASIINLKWVTPFCLCVFNNEVSLIVLQRALQLSSFRSLLVGHLIYFSLILIENGLLGLGLLVRY